MESKYKGGKFWEKVIKRVTMTIFQRIKKAGKRMPKGGLEPPRPCGALDPESSE